MIQASSMSGKTAFTYFWIADIVSKIGGRAWSFAVPVLVLEFLHGDSRDVGYLTAAASISYLFLSLPAGVWIERSSKRNIMAIASILRGLLIGAVTALWLLDELSLIGLYAVGLTIGLAALFYDIAYQAYLPTIVRQKDQQLANTFLEGTTRATTVAGPVVYGAFARLIGAPFLILIGAIGYLASGILVFRLPTVDRPAANGRPLNMGRQLREAWGFVQAHPVLRRIAFAMTFSNIFGVALSTLVPVLVLETLRLTPLELGFALSAAEAGGLTATIALGIAHHRQVRVARILVVGLLVAAASGLLAPLAGSLAGMGRGVSVSVVMLSTFGSTFGGVMFSVTQVSLRQLVCPKEMLARVSACMRFLVWSTVPLAAVAGGWSAHAFGVVPTLWVCAIGALLTVFPIFGVGAAISEDHQAVEAGRA
jgi:MFS family permease